MSAEQRFFDKVAPEPNSGCWLWCGTGTMGGYGQFWDGGKLVLAHRWAYTYFTQEVPEGLDLDHLCRVRCCVNPAHLEPVTRKENCRRAPTSPLNRDHCINGHPYNEKNLRIAVAGDRRCRECKNQQDREYRVRARIDKMEGTTP